MSHHLSKSRFVAGWQCPRLLWWMVHDPDARELQKDLVSQDLAAQGNEVGRLATERFPGGVAVERRHDDWDGKFTDTRQALAAGAPAVFEAAFYEDDVFVAVDILERLDQGFRLVEVKSTSSVKEQHVTDAAVQTWVVRRAGLDVREVSLMHLNPHHRHPDVGDLFALTDITEQVEDFLPQVPRLIGEQLALLAGPDPGSCIGPRCKTASEACPFESRCWPQAPDHVKRLHNVGVMKALGFMEAGVHTFGDLPEGAKLGKPAQRQLDAWRTGRVIVEAGLAEALSPLRGRIGFLDFESVSRALPAWPGLGPWGMAPAQFSYHERGRDGKLSHTAWLADGPHDPRPWLARALLEATRRAEVVATYHTFERTCVRALAEALPELADELEGLDARLVDLCKIIRDHVAHPDFGGSFSIKAVLPALVPELSYEGLDIGEGQTAGVELARLLLHGEAMDAKEREAKRAALLDYCHLDTLAMVRLLERLEGLAGGTLA